MNSFLRTVMTAILTITLVCTCGTSATGKPPVSAALVKPKAPLKPPMPGVIPPPVHHPDECKHPCVVAAAIVGIIVPGTSMVFAEFMDKARVMGADAVVLGISSPGGDFNASEEIFNLIKDSEIPVYCYVKKAAMSGAFWILQACKERVGESDSRLMTHSPYVITQEGAILNRAVLTKLLSQLGMMESVMSSSIAGRLGMTEADMVSRLQRGDWFMSASQAVEAKALDRVVAPGKASFDGYIDAITAGVRRP
jgi:ATP-dependent protease ClpP protease subunit